ncbi:thioredoxin family protein [Pinisolibacter sp.]|uniref:thioredoxin family protein n=1 Tax=Pinisolibacter sp. TaxID=2172024 RepID=UPI002FDF07C4
MSVPRFASLLFALTASMVPLAGGAAAIAAELVVLEKAGCPYCARFEREVGKTYDKTDEGKQAPLKRIDNEKPFPEDYRFVSPDRITPTFVLVDQGREIGRLRGYPGEDFFYAALGTMLEKLPGK